MPYYIKVDPEKNRLYITLANYVTDNEVQNWDADLAQSISKLSPGFSTIINFERSAITRNKERLIGGIRKYINLMSASAIVAKKFYRSIMRSYHNYFYDVPHQSCFHNPDYAEQWLDAHTNILI